MAAAGDRSLVAALRSRSTEVPLELIVPYLFQVQNGDMSDLALLRRFLDV